MRFMEKEPYTDKMTGLRFIFRSLRYRNYRLFFVGQGISLIGTWMQRIAMPWLIYHLTGSPLLLGVIDFVSQIPSFVLMPFAGVLTDRWNRHRILIITQILSMVQALILAILFFAGIIRVWHVIVLGVFSGCINAFDVPARQSFVIEMVEKKEDLGNAIALNSSMFNVARLLGPGIAGILIAYTGEGICFLLNALSYIVVIVCLLNMKVVPRKSIRKSSRVVSELKEGIAYAFGFAPIRYVILLLALISLMGMPYSVLMPVFAKEILHGDSHTFGFLMAASGLGALTGAIYLAYRKSVRGLGKVIPLCAGLFGFGLIGFSLSRFFPLSLALMTVIGFGMMMQMASGNTILQTVVEDDKRGRVMSFYTMAIMGTAPFGSLLAGKLADILGVADTLTIGGISCILGALLFAGRLPEMRKAVHPIYVRQGIIPKDH